MEQGKLRADPAKVQAVADWPTPTLRKKITFLGGFAHFYRRFVRNFSQVAAPLTRLTSTASPFNWTPESHAAFLQLKIHYSAGVHTSRP